MRKKLYSIVLFMTMILSCFSLFACEKERYHTCYTVGTFSGYRVDCVRIEIGVLWAVEYYVDDVYICTFPDGSYDYEVYKNEKDCGNLKTAYKQGLITHDDLLAIAEAEKPRDDLNKDQEL